MKKLQPNHWFIIGVFILMMSLMSCSNDEPITTEKVLSFDYISGGETPSFIITINGKEEYFNPKDVETIHSGDRIQYNEVGWEGTPTEFKMYVDGKLVVYDNDFPINVDYIVK